MCKLRIKEILSEKGWTQHIMADKMGVTDVALSRIVTRGRPDYDTLERMAAALDCEIADLFVRTKTTIICPRCHQVITIKTE